APAAAHAAGVLRAVCGAGSGAGSCAGSGTGEWGWRAEGQIKQPRWCFSKVLLYREKYQVGQGPAKVEKTWWDWLGYGLLTGGAAVFLFPILIATCTPFMWITTHSLPWGIYRRTQEPIARGRLVHFCLPEPLARYALEREYISAGFCPGAVQELVKSVAALAADEGGVSATGGA